MIITMQSTDHNLMSFEEYCKIRDSMQVQLMINGRPTNVFNANDITFAGLILMEQQWQYACQMSNVNAGLQLSNGFFKENMALTNPDTSFLSFSQSLNAINSKPKPRRPNGQKRTIKKYEGKPKKPLTSFMLFLKDFRKKLNLSHPSEMNKISPHEINKLAGKKWHLLPENIKCQYKNTASIAFAKWRQENFTTSQTTSVIKEIESRPNSKDTDINIQGTSKNTEYQTSTKRPENHSTKRLSATSSCSGSSSSSEDSSGSSSESLSN